MSRLRDGDAETEKHFVSHFTNVIRLSLRYRLRSWELIEDIRQETFLRVLNFIRSDRSLDHPERFGAYVHSVSINVMMELLRASTRHPPIPEEAQHLEDRRASAEGSLVTRERKEFVRAILDDLAEKDRQILRAVFLEEQDKDEICRDFQVDRDYLRVLVHRAKTRFREALEKREALAREALVKEAGHH
ncbi:MAG TPA: sigma-70 family RNA polymerase sigma factor [Bryobacteraceae bacterium]|nr:sigma-70 family RNA polymerase sigma factor [Bryobacteraceae bacterium]